MLSTPEPIAHTHIITRDLWGFDSALKKSPRSVAKVGKIKKNVENQAKNLSTANHIMPSIYACCS